MSAFLVTATWDDCPHLTEEAKKTLWDSIPAYQRDARTKGIPALGAGAIYPIPEADITVKPFGIPKNWPCAYGMDVGWNRTAGIWGAQDPTTKVRYLFSEHYRGEAEPVIHAQAWKARGLWMPGKIDPAAKGRSQIDGQQLVTIYRGLGLTLDFAQNAVESGIYQMWTLLSTGQLKVFSSLTNFLAEYRLYQRDEKGRVVKKRDHLMDASRYLNFGKTDWWVTRPVGWRDPDDRSAPDSSAERKWYDEGSQAQAWMA